MVDICIRHVNIIQQFATQEEGLLPSVIISAHQSGAGAEDRRDQQWAQSRWEGNSRSNWESSINIHTPPRVKQMATGKLLDTTQGAQLSAL